MEDKEILEKLLNPETQEYGFNLLVKQYQERIYHLARKMVINHDDAADLTQDVFIKIHKNIKTFKGESALFTWIYRITSNECLSFLRKRKRQQYIPWGETFHPLTPQIDTSPLISGDEIQRKLRKAILKLPPKQQLVFNLRYYEELKFDEISEITNTSVGALKASYHLAVKKIEKFLNAD